jgi:hypothetical protein
MLADTTLQAAPAAAAPKAAKAGKGAKKAKFVLDLSVAEKDKLLKISDFVSARRCCNRGVAFAEDFPAVSFPAAGAQQRCCFLCTCTMYL